jgi:hypothetical protein
VTSASTVLVSCLIVDLSTFRLFVISVSVIDCVHKVAISSPAIFDHRFEFMHRQADNMWDLLGLMEGLCI